MRTEFPPQALEDSSTAAAEAAIRRCVRCGFCTSTCPTYVLSREELDGPRGRIYLIKQVMEGAPPTRETQRHLDRVFHRDHLGGSHESASRPAGRRPQGLGQTHQDQLGIGVGVEKGPTGRQGHRRAVVATHAIDGQANRRHALKPAAHRAWGADRTHVSGTLPCHPSSCAPGRVRR